MRKSAILFIAALCALMTAGCGNKGEETTSPPETTLIEAAATPAVTAAPAPVDLQVLAPTPTPEPTPTPTPEPTPEPTPTPRGVLDVAYDGMFSLDGEVREGLSYRDAMTSLTCTEVNDAEKTRTGKKLVYFVTDVWLQDPTDLRRGMMNENNFAYSKQAPITELSAKYDALFAVSGDFVTAKDKALVIWNGEVIFDAKQYRYDTCVLYRDGRMECLSPEELNPEQLLQDGAWQTWSFGPTLLDGEGTPLTEFRLPDSIESRNPRIVLGYYEPGHYCAVMVEGRQNGYSAGLSIQETAQLMSDLGCKQAYNLDGGISAQITFFGKRVNKPSGNRSIRDIVYVAAHEEPAGD